MYQNNYVLNDLLVVHIQYYTLLLASVNQNLLQASNLTENSMKMNRLIHLHQKQSNNVQMRFDIYKTEGKRGPESIT